MDVELYSTAPSTQMHPQTLTAAAEDALGFLLIYINIKWIYSFEKPSSVWNSNPDGKVVIIFRFFPLSDFPQCQPDSSIINQPVSRDRGHQTKVTTSIIEIDILQQSISWWQLMIPCMINVNQSSLWLI